MVTRENGQQILVLMLLDAYGVIQKKYSKSNHTVTLQTGCTYVIYSAHHPKRLVAFCQYLGDYCICNNETWTEFRKSGTVTHEYVGYVHNKGREVYFLSEF